MYTQSALFFPISMRTELYLSIITMQNQKAISFGEFFCGHHRKGKMGKIIPQADKWVVFLIKARKTKM